ncbi:hypothetical protein [Flavobacterium soyae]|uniref:Uncharacterized protein n=1 Tax=Flavobacterium soyae TaxID=2903098 RepID=A0ABZ2UF03_9FLAO
MVYKVLLKAIKISLVLMICQISISCKTTDKTANREIKMQYSAVFENF